ncbi:MAG: hypothetical protein ACXQTI_05500 [Candidatus Nezhaarchaeales archaeon]
MSRHYQERSRRLRDATYEERKAKALTEGTRVEYLTCPLCGLNRPLEKWGKPTVFKVKPDYAIIQVRYGGGRGRGFFLNEKESIKLEDLKNHYPDVFENLKEEVEKLYEIIEKL